MIEFDAAKIDWAKTDGLIPAIVQDADTLRVLMLGYVNLESLQATLTSGLVTFYSRSKQWLWQKGETSGHVLKLADIRLDCDGDTLLLLAHPQGPTCHNGTQSCFGDDLPPNLSVLGDLAATIAQRRHHADANSYTAKLFTDGINRIAQKVGEEGVETALAAVTHDPGLTGEVADLLYHLLVLLAACDTGWREVLAVLHKRSKRE